MQCERRARERDGARERGGEKAADRGSYIHNACARTARRSRLHHALSTTTTLCIRRPPSPRPDRCRRPRAASWRRSSSSGRALGLAVRVGPGGPRGALAHVLTVVCLGAAVICSRRRHVTCSPPPAPPLLCHGTAAAALERLAPTHRDRRPPILSNY